jgi:hypothetical protein
MFFIRYLSSAPRTYAVRLTCAVFLVVWCADSAKAECGDYVQVASDKQKHSETNEPDPQKPCSGPSCSKKPTTPPLLPLAMNVHVKEPVAIGAIPSPDPMFAHDQPHSENVLIAADPFLASIFHPPR